MITILDEDRNFVGFGVHSGTLIAVKPTDRTTYMMRWLLPCGHMVSDWARECKCPDDKC